MPVMSVVVFELVPKYIQQSTSRQTDSEEGHDASRTFHFGRQSTVLRALHRRIAHAAATAHLRLTKSSLVPIWFK